MRRFDPDIVASRRESALSWLLAGYLRLCRRTCRWRREGDAEFVAAMQQGPVVLVFWHSRSAMASSVLPQDRSPMICLFVRNRDGRVSAGVQARLGLRPFGMAGRASNRAASRQILRLMAEGHSLALPADGHRGPARILQDAPLDWARVTGRPVFVHANAVRRHWQLPGWDRLMFPLPFSRGASVYQRWQGSLPRQADPATLAAAHDSLSAALDEVTARADALAGLPAGLP